MRNESVLTIDFSLSLLEVVLRTPEGVASKGRRANMREISYFNR